MVVRSVLVQGMANNMTTEQLHKFRQDIDACIQTAEADMKAPQIGTGSQGTPAGHRYIRELAITRTKLQEAKMWVGKCLELLGSQLPEEFRDKAPGAQDVPAPVTTTPAGPAMTASEAPVTGAIS